LCPYGELLPLQVLKSELPLCGIMWLMHY